MDKRGAIDFIAVLLIVAIVVSLFTTFFAINKIESIKTLPEAITGRGTSGQINLTIEQNLSINVLVLNMSFGTGSVDAGDAHATINSSSSRVIDVTTTMLGVANWTNTSVFSPLSIQLMNDGNVNASVTLTSSAVASAFLGGTSPVFEFNGSNKEALSCLNGLVDWTSISGSAQTLCQNMSSSDTKDELYIDARLTIPYNTQGEKETFWTFGATAVG